MLAGYRAVSPDEVGYWPGDFVQISCYRWLDNRMELMTECARRCREKGIPYVIHPVGYELLKADEREMNEIREMAVKAGWALLLHDERPNGNRVNGEEIARLWKILNELGRHTTLSIENAASTEDSPWFWKTFADSITLDIGHIEASGFNSIEYIEGLDKELTDKIDYVHLHRKGPFRSGLIDHWPVTPDCREVEALKALLGKRPGARVILELNEVEETGENLNLVRSVWEELRAQGKV
jgi:hypothetical protein